ncbi:MAG TPA: Rid family detoxifying hydrolase [Syntrophales bacterium]|nr:Rid family detoxifying hydrolase [Syntrophales bacterium]HOL58658.1 Rid family detoxifying hydrolase [Syntrophales bacterium]HPO35054.1 Rid family detoxifying hydrolase [Syntrophales bacterium]
MEKAIPATPIPSVGPYSQVVVAGEFIFCSGQIPIDPETGEVITEQVALATDRCLKNLSLVLASCGSSLKDVVKTTVYLTDMKHFSAMNEVYARYFPDAPPARSTVAVFSLPRGVPVEIEAIAIVGKAPHG